jgi:adenylate cyclase
MATRQDTPYLRTYSLACTGIAHGVAGNYAAAVQALVEGVNYLREARVAMEVEPEMLASIADCQLRSGAVDAAIKTARETIAVCGDRNARLPQCRASITLASALVAMNNDGHDEAAALLQSAEALIDLTGATIYNRLLDEARAKIGVRVRG